MKQGAVTVLVWAEKCGSMLSWGLKSQHRSYFQNLKLFLGSVPVAEEMMGESDKHQAKVV